MATTKRRRTSGPEQDTSSVLLDTDFEFDAPCWYVDLPKLLSGDLRCDDDDDSWFEVYHPSHFVHRQSMGRSGQHSDASKGDSRDEGRRKAAVAVKDENADAQANMSGRHSNQSSMRARLEDFRTSKSQKQSQSHLTQPTQASKAKATAKAAAPATAPARVAGQVRPSASNSRTRPKAPGSATAAAAVPSTVRVGPRSGAAKAAAAAAPAPAAAPAAATAAIGAAAARRPRAVKQVDMRGLEPIGDIANCTAVVKTAKRAATAAAAQAGGGSSSAQAAAAAAKRRSSGFAAKHASAAQAGGDGEEMCDLEALISKHNKSVMKGKATYEPSRHTLKDYKAWETKTGKRYHELSVDQRAEANAAIDDMKRQAAAAAASKQ